MDEKNKPNAGEWLKRRDKWMRELLASSFISRNGKLAGIYVALRLSAKRPFTYPAMNTMAKDLDVSLRQIARAMKELEDENFLRVQRQPGRPNLYRLDL